MTSTTISQSTAPPPRKRGGGPEGVLGRSRERLGWMLIAPTVLTLLVVAIYPLIRTVWLSFTNARLGSTRAVDFVGLENYTYLLTNSTFLKSIWNTIAFTVGSVALETILGLGVALVIHSSFKGRGLVRTAILVPWAIPTVVSAQMWAWMYNDVFGVINDLWVVQLGILPQKVAWLANPSTALAAIIFVDVWKTTPFMALLLLAGLQVIPEDLYEAARVDGANRWQSFWRITLPLLKPALLVALVFRTMDALRVFDVIFVMKSYALETISMAIFARQTLIDLQRIGEGSAASVIVFAIIAVFVLLYIRMLRIEEV